MNFSKVKKVIGSLAPTLATALNCNPVTMMAANMIAEVLGCNPNPKSIQQSIQNATPQQLIDLKKAESEFEIKMKEMEIDVFQLETQDIQDARSKFKDDWTPKFLGSLTIVGFFSYIGIITMYPVADASDDIVMLIIGSLTGIATAVISFYFGSSHKKNKED